MSPGRSAPELRRLSADHAQATLDFELANRAYFAVSITDRGDDYFTHFTDGFAALLSEQDSGAVACYVLVTDDGEIVGRFNLTLLADHRAVLGYRVAEHATGRGLASSTVRELCRLSVTAHGLRTIEASVSTRNAASQRVLVNAGFVSAGPAEPASIGGRTGTRFECVLAES